MSSLSPTHPHTNNNNFVTSLPEDEDSLEAWFRRAFGEREGSQFKSDHVKLQLLCKQFFEVVETARKASHMPHPLATCTAAYFFQKLAALRPGTNGSKTDTLCASLLRLVYADQNDRQGGCFSTTKKSMLRTKLECSNTPLTLLSFTPYYDLVRELRDSVKAFESEYATFQVEFDEVKEMVQRSHRVIGTALKRWEDLFLRVTLKHWRFQVRGNVKVKKFTQRLRESIRMACHREILDKHFQAWMCYLLEQKYQRAEENIQNADLQIEEESKRHKHLVTRLHEVEKHIRVVRASRKKIVDENSVRVLSFFFINRSTHTHTHTSSQELKAQFANSYNKDNDMNFEHREFFKSNPEFYSRTRHEHGTVFEKNQNQNKDEDLKNPDMLCGFSALTLDRLKFLVRDFNFKVPDLKSFHFRIRSWLIKIAPELQDIYKHYAHTDTVKVCLNENKEEKDENLTKSLCGKDLDGLAHDARLYGAGFQRNELAEIINQTIAKVGFLNKSNMNKKKKKKWKSKRGTIKSLASLVPSLLRNATVDRSYEGINLDPSQFVECIIRIAFEKASRTKQCSNVVRGPRYISSSKDSSGDGSSNSSQWSRLKKKSRAAIFVRGVRARSARISIISLTSNATSLSEHNHSQYNHSNTNTRTQVQRKTRKKRMSFMPGSILSTMQVPSKSEIDSSGGGDAAVLLEWLQYICDDHIFMYVFVRRITPRTLILRLTLEHTRTGTLTRAQHKHFYDERLRKFVMIYLF